MPIQNMTPQQLKTRLDAGEDMLVIDVRNPYELEIASVDFAKHIVLNELPDSLDEIPKDKPIVLLCRSGSRSMQAAYFLANEGWDENNLFNVQGGIIAWSREIDPSIPTY